MLTVDNTQLTALIAKHEGGHQLNMYKDTKDIWTIGVGHNIQDRGISLAVSELMFKEDLQITLDECAKAFWWWNTLNDVRQAAIIDMVFNMGLPTFRTFKNTIVFLKNNLWASASKEILRGSGPNGISRYYADVGSRAETISKMLETGEWQ